ncbi:short-chain dehydrogenase, partial [Streptomyces sp. SID6013]|nr:short-chain dehydrogenase [Streptomyces sp. SID6013]
MSTTDTTPAITEYAAEFAGRTALVTGAASGIGLATA